MTDPQTTWKTALADLEGQMTRATFETWLAGTVALAGDEHTLTIAVKNNYAVEWLSNRLYPVIERTVRRITGNGTGVQFVVPATPAPPARPSTDDAPEPALPAWESPDFDPSDTKKVPGWIPVPEYANRFWAPLLGQTAWRVWELVRHGDKRRDKEEFTPTTRYSVPQLARLVPCAQQSLTGRNVKCAEDTPGAQQITARGGQRLNAAPELIWAKHLPGALEILEREGVAAIERHGDRKAAVVMISVRVSLPLLHPSQVDKLPPDLQEQHDRWIADHGLDPEDWQ